MRVGAASKTRVKTVTARQYARFARCHRRQRTADNRIVRVFILLIAAFCASAQAPQSVPAFSGDNILPHGRLTKLLAPGMVLELWGQNLAPVPWCGQEQIPKGLLPLEICGVRVLIGPRPAELMYVSGGQINLRVPADVPAEGFAPIQVCVGTVCSAPVAMRFSASTALLTLEQPAYVHMPVWIDVDAPAPYFVPYPCAYWPWNLPGYEFEVLRNGHPLAPIPQPSPPSTSAVAPADHCDGPTLRGRLPLHLLYRFEEPGTYSVRFTARKNGEILYQSDWTNIEIEPFSEEKREEWLRSLEATLSQRSVNDVVPSLLAWPDERALAVLSKVIPADTSRCMNFDCVRLAFGRAALAGFDGALLCREIPQGRLLQLCPPGGTCK